MGEMSEDRIRSFITNPNALSITGPRRVSKSDLIDLVRDVLCDVYPGINIIFVEGTMDISIISKDGMSAILSKEPFVSEVMDSIRSVLSDRVLLFYVQELCHQVPVCVKGFHGSEGCSLSYKHQSR
ncbi:MAG: hypothetical protein KRP56_03085 [Candidatus Methanogranum gryphiswaldense]|nr:MAG: hypothetical protein KRP56_03085 [Candidatus Methanogranum sp. U3.2.1]